MMTGYYSTLACWFRHSVSLMVGRLTLGAHSSIWRVYTYTMGFELDS